MIVWLNGTFGAGKTTTSEKLVELLPDARVFDSEYVGFMLRHVLDDVPHRNFQEWTPWRSLTVATARDVLGFVGGTLVIPQTVLVEAYWKELAAGFAAAAIPVRHYVLHADSATLRERILGDTEEIRGWRLDHVEPYAEAFDGWLSRAAAVVPTTGRPPAEVAGWIAEDVRRAAHSP
ncbi:AAA family ATPase [Streptomyces xanthii]|uniref:AAA family ATPase n=1 Tax=Streptomyces xanthii TaxID=2768069 RepID=A0A7H1BCV4_9ACTN|nr:AAA family ATPase [Streptomyces xanthii]QNS06559.1 AAA family ATPase [Streptomyces xanthii]